MSPHRLRRPRSEARASTFALIPFLYLMVVALPGQNPIPAAPFPPQTPQPGATPPGFQALQKPADPSKVRGTYEIDGRTVEVTEGQFWAAFELLKPHEEKPQLPLQAQRVLEHILLLGEAEAMGFRLSPEEADLINPAKTNPTFAPHLRERWKSQGITEEAFLEYQAQSRAIQRLKDWHANASRVRSSAIFDLWKRDNHLYRIAYLEFQAAPYEAELRRTPPDEAALKTFWSTNAAVQEKHRSSTCVTADVVIFDPREVSAAELEQKRGTRKITRDEKLAYFNRNRDRMMAQIPSDQRPKLYPPPGQKAAVKDIVSPFEILQDQIEREMILGDGIGTAFEAARSAQDGAAVKGIAKAHGLKHVRLERSDRRVLLQDHPHLGHQLFTDLFNAAPGSLSPQITHQGALQFFWRLEDKAVSSLPAFEEVRNLIIEDWYKAESYNRAMAAAKSFLDGIDAEVAKESKEKEAQIDKETLLQADEEIKGKNITDPQQQDAIRQKMGGMGEARKRKLRADLAPKYFDSAVAAAKLAVREIPPFSFLAQQIDRSAISDPKEQVEAFLKTSYQIRAMEANQISPILSDTVTNSHFVVRLAAKEEPTFAMMPTVEYQQRRLAIERQAMYTSNYQWTLFQVQKRRNWKEK